MNITGNTKLEPYMKQEKPRIKLCGLSRPEDISVVNQVLPEYIGFVFAKKSRRFISANAAALLKQKLNPSINAVGVFVNEDPKVIASLLKQHTIDLAQLHGQEDSTYIDQLRQLTDCPIIQAFQIKDQHDLDRAKQSIADYVLLDSPSAGSGTTFDWSMLTDMKRPYFLAGGLNPYNIAEALQTLHPYGVDVSSGIESNGYKDKIKIEKFVQSVRLDQKGNKL